MKRTLIPVILCSVALAGCAAVTATSQGSMASAVVPAAAIYGGTAAVANPPDPDNLSATTDKIGANIQAGAAEAQGHVDNFAGATKDGFYESTDHVADWMKPTTPKPNQSIAASYCYHVFQDILCYRRPMPGWETRLAGYQPITAEPPPPAVMQPLAQHAQDASQLPVNRVASSKPVFTQLPTQASAEKPAEDAVTPAAAAASEATHEQLPDPALAPQL